MMKKLILLAALAAAMPLAAKTTTVKGYIKSDGTYVAPHIRTTPNGTKLDNYSTQPNINPYTGQQGTVDPYKPTANNPYGTPDNKKQSSTTNPYGH